MQDGENVKNPDNIIEIPEDAFTSKESREKAGFTSSLGAQKPPKSRNRAVVCLIAAASVLSLMCGYILFDSKDLLQNRDFIQSRMAIKNNKSLQELSSPKPKKIAHYASLIKQLDKNKPVDKAAAEKVLQTFLDYPDLGSNAAAVIADANGKIIAAKNEDLALQPASTMKTLTALAASHTLDMASTLDTLVYASCDEGGSVARIVLRGGGDMLLGAGQNDPNHVNGRAGLETLANKTAAALKKRGVKIVQFAVDDSLFGAKRYPELINENDEEGRFYAPTSSVAVDEGRNRDFAAWVSYGNDADDTDDYPLLDRHPAVSTGLIFANLLQKSGIDVREWKGDSAKITKAAKVSGSDSMHVSYKKPLISADFSQIARVCSAPLSEIMAYMLRHSDNSLAEEFGRLTALAMRKSNSPKGATLAVQDVLRNLGIDINGLHMSDCSGLSPKSAVRAITLIQVQAQNLKEGIGAAAAEGLALPGVWCTSAKKRLVDKSAAGLMRVKTGFLGDVSSMVGNVSRKSGGALTFAVVVNPPGDVNYTYVGINKMMAELTNL
ncbi:D-alanyl-D-alanine carboxypeptidase/D-alanyl-D-alanine-endopeptidase [Gardnerella pickettii]|uniref:D-alanyl-D-alanine carboxypeptidase/D-alanyl-D-alanine-endopeptidase n=1 Tax=Gardnerella pickettii TaxID=2914924 RepID=UPI000C7BC1E4|nr:D-alanyl-D-alanine carboxypeptidase [Gardnerella pickettii]PKZ39703.1 D-alanyl-D-alanine carboxypeptidase [Gardnerella pickettii]